VAGFYSHGDGGNRAWVWVAAYWQRKRGRRFGSDLFMAARGRFVGGLNIFSEKRAMVAHPRHARRRRRNLTTRGHQAVKQRERRRTESI
jgi:hypothetical protein